MEKILGGPSLLYRHHQLQEDVKAARDNYDFDEFSLRSAQLSVSFDNIEVFLHPGKPD